MKRISSFLILLLFQLISLKAQTVTGIIIDSNFVRLTGLSVNLYSMGNIYSATTYYDGSFNLQLPSDVKDENLPSGYNISNNYPNPFNPRTRIDFTLPKATSIKIELFNVMGQRVRNTIEANLGAGTNHIDLELNGLSNGFYFARINIDGSYSVTKKLMLIYGSQHLITNKSSASSNIKKANRNIYIDSIEISGKFIERTRILPSAFTQGSTLALGKIKVKKFPDRENPCSKTPTVKYEGKSYQTVQIGSQCWLKENLDAGIMINGSLNQKNNNLIEKYCYNNDTNNCIAYGGLYQWDEAMQYTTSEGAQGICPKDWHIPSKTDVDTLYNIINNNNYNIRSPGQGYDEGGTAKESGFSGLMAGHRDFNTGDYGHLGMANYLWISRGTSGNADLMYLPHYGNNFGGGNYEKIYGFSIRCIKDDENILLIPAVPVLNSPANQGVSTTIPAFLTWYSSKKASSYKLQVSTSSLFISFVYNQSNLQDTSQIITGLSNSKTYYWRVSAVNEFGASGWSPAWSFTTIAANSCGEVTKIVYDSKVYNTISVGTQCWLKENLDIGTLIQGDKDQTNNGKIEKYCYNDSLEYCTKFGGLYQWAEAVQYKNGATNTTIANPPLTGNVQGICPAGWHIPSSTEYQVLLATVKNNGNSLKEIGQGDGSGTGTNTSGFAALIHGIRYLKDGSYFHLDNTIYFWSATEIGPIQAPMLYIYGSTSDAVLSNSNKSFGFNIRCIKD